MEGFTGQVLERPERGCCILCFSCCFSCFGSCGFRCFAGCVVSAFVLAFRTRCCTVRGAVAVAVDATAVADRDGGVTSLKPKKAASSSFCASALRRRGRMAGEAAGGGAWVGAGGKRPTVGLASLTAVCRCSSAARRTAMVRKLTRHADASASSLTRPTCVSVGSAKVGR